MGDTGNWCLIESDPGVFTELICEYGCKGLQVEELWSLDPENFAELRPVMGLIFLFKWREGEKVDGDLVRDSRLDDIYFSKQVIRNACATQAIVNLLFNVDMSGSDRELGAVLNNFKSFTSSLDSASRGLALSNSDEIRTLHNSFSKNQGMLEIESEKPSEDVYHYVAYVPVKGRVYELDGIKEFPIDLGKIDTTDGKDWIDTIRPIVEKRLERHSSDGFNLMAVIGDRRQLYQKQMQEFSEKQENARRRHNYIPFIVELLKILAREGKLVPLIEEAQEKAKERNKKEEDKKKAEKAEPLQEKMETN